MQNAPPRRVLNNGCGCPTARISTSLATAVATSADIIVTVNARDFPRNILSEEGLDRRDPDSLLHGFWQVDPDGIADTANRVLAEANRLSGDQWSLRALMKKARLPRLGKALTT